MLTSKLNVQIKPLRIIAYREYLSNATINKAIYFNHIIKI